MIEEIKKFREKYPDYGDMDDATLANLLASKYPEYSDLPDKVKAEQPKESLGMNLAREAPRTIGGMVGGGVGKLFGPAAPITVPLFTGIGAMTGQAFENVRESIYEPQVAPKTAWEGIKKTVKAGYEEPAYQLGGEKAFQFAGRLLKPYAKKVSEEARITIDYLKDRIKPILMPAEATESRMLDIAENVAEGSIFGGGRISAFKLKRQNVMEKMADEIIDEFGRRASSDELGGLFEKLISNKRKLYNDKLVTPLFNQVEDMVKPIPKMIPEGVPLMTKLESVAPISLESLKKFSKPLSRVGKDIGGIEGKNAGDDLVSGIMDLPNVVDFSVARELRSRLISRIDEFSVANAKAPAIGKAKQLIKLLDAEIESGLGKANPEALAVWREANALYKAGEQQFNNRLIRGLIRRADPDMGGDPEGLVRAVFKPGMANRISVVKSALDGNTWRQYQSYFMQDLIKKSVDEEGKLVGLKLYNNMYGKTGYGEKVMNQIFSPEQVDEITKFATALKTTQTKSGTGTPGTMYIQLAQGGALTGIVGSIFMPKTAKYITLGSSGIILGGPSILSRAMLNPSINKLLSEGIHLSPGTVKAGGIATRLGAAITRAEMEHERWMHEDEPKTKAFGYIPTRPSTGVPLGLD